MMGVYDQKDFRGRQQWYPFGEHPVTQRLRDQLELVNQAPRTEASLAVREDILRRLYAFEAGETHAKMIWFEYMQDQVERERDAAKEALERLVAAVEPLMASTPTEILNDGTLRYDWTEALYAIREAIVPARTVLA